MASTNQCQNPDAPRRSLSRQYWFVGPQRIQVHRKRMIETEAEGVWPANGKNAASVIFIAKSKACRTATEPRSVPREKCPPYGGHFDEEGACRRDYDCGCGSRPPVSGRGRGLPAGGTAEPRGVAGSITDSRVGRLPVSRSLISSPLSVSNSSRPLARVSRSARL